MNKQMTIRKGKISTIKMTQRADKGQSLFEGYQIG